MPDLADTKFSELKGLQLQANAVEVWKAQLLTAKPTAHRKPESGAPRSCGSLVSTPRTALDAKGVGSFRKATSRPAGSSFPPEVPVLLVPGDEEDYLRDLRQPLCGHLCWQSLTQDSHETARCRPPDIGSSARMSSSSAKARVDSLGARDKIASEPCLTCTRQGAPFQLRLGATAEPWDDPPGHLGRARPPRSHRTPHPRSPRPAAPARAGVEPHRPRSPGSRPAANESRHAGRRHCCAASSRGAQWRRQARCRPCLQPKDTAWLRPQRLQAARLSSRHWSLYLPVRSSSTSP